MGGMEAQYGNKTAVVVDITSKSGTKPGFGSAQVFGGSNETVNPSFEYGGTIGEKFRFYILNSYVTTNRGLEPPTLGKTNNHNQSEKNNTYLRGDYQHDNRNNFSWIFLGSVAKYRFRPFPIWKRMLTSSHCCRLGSCPMPLSRSTSFKRKAISTAS